MRRRRLRMFYLVWEAGMGADVTVHMWQSRGQLAGPVLFLLCGTLSLRA